MKLKNKLIFMALSIVVFVTVVSTVVVCFLINKQNRDVAGALLKKSANIISDDITIKQEKGLEQIRQMVTTNASKLRYIAEYGKKSEEMSVESNYRYVLEAMSSTAVMGDLRKIFLYDMEGDLSAFASTTDHKLSLGYIHRHPETIYKVASLNEGEEFKKEALKQKRNLPENIPLKLKKGIPDQEKTGFQERDNYLCIVLYAPVMGEVYDAEKDKLSKKQVALVTAIRRLDNTFAKRMSNLTGTKINIFTKKGLSTGNLKDYNKLQMKGIKEEDKNWRLSDNKILIADATINGIGYFQGVMPIYSDSKYVGSISALYSNEIVKSNTWEMIKLLALVSLICILIIIPIAIIFSNFLNKPINRATASLADISDQLASACTQVTSSSQTLAEGASEQAASLEETSSSLEEISSMTKQNADNAKEADGLSKDTLKTLKEADTSMKELIKSMEDTSNASNDVSKIIKTIDEIAFQTNLLALNAAVEAARAGEAGSGFAVVADEVRNLALRSSEASGNTQQLVDDIINKINTGSNLVKKTDESYQHLDQSVKKVTTLVKEISTSSNEQANGVQQINTTVHQMDKVTQKNAANAEESASASQQMNSYAVKMKSVVKELETMVKGKTDKKGEDKHAAGKSHFYLSTNS